MRCKDTKKFCKAACSDYKKITKSGWRYSFSENNVYFFTRKTTIGMDVTTKGLNGNALKVIAINKKKQEKTRKNSPVSPCFSCFFLNYALAYELSNRYSSSASSSQTL